jgi:hypothetical protein
MSEGSGTQILSFEWVKAWHPDIADREIAISDYARAMMQYLKNAKVDSSPRISPADNAKSVI